MLIPEYIEISFSNECNLILDIVKDPSRYWNEIKQHGSMQSLIVLDRTLIGPNVYAKEEENPT